MEQKFAWLVNTTFARDVLQIGTTDAQTTSDVFANASIACVTDAKETVDAIPRVRTIVAKDPFDADFLELNFSQIKFDVILAHELTTMASMLQFIVTCSPLLKPNGALILFNTDPSCFDTLRSVVPRTLCAFVEQHDDGTTFAINCSAKPSLPVLPLLNTRPCVCVRGMDGLGNTLYQVVCAIDYCERTPGAQVVLLDGPSFVSGTAIYEGRKQALTDENNVIVPYKTTIFSKFTFVGEFPKPRVDFENSYGATQIDWDAARTHLEIKSYQQHSALFQNSMQHWDKYLKIKDVGITRHLLNVYAHTQTKPFDWFRTCVVIGIRRGKDFRHMTAITNRVLNRVYKAYYAGRPVLIVGDVADAAPLLANDEALDFPYTMIAEADVTQLNLAFLCHSMIVSESTFHAWIAYFMETAFPKTDITCFNNTDLTRRNLTMPNWRHVNL